MKAKKLFSIKKLIILGISIFLLLFLANFSYAAKIEKVEGQPRSISLKVTSDKKIKKILIYKQSSNNQYVLFYKASPHLRTEYVATIPENKLSTESETHFKVIVVEEDGTRTVEDIEGEKLTPYPSMNPSETAKPSWSPSPIPTKPTPTTTASATTGPSESTSPAPSESSEPSSSSDPGTSPSASTEPSQDPSEEPSPEPTTSGEISGNLEVHYIDPNSRVDAIYIKVGDKGIYIDGGFHSDAKKEIAYMERIGVQKIDYYIGSHAHSNHVGAAGPIVSKYGIKEIICSKATHNGKPSVKYMALNKATSQTEKDALNSAKWTIWGPGDSMEVNGLKIYCLGPISIEKTDPGKTAENHNSLILRMEYGNTTFLFGGDTGASQLKAANKKYPNKIDVDVYKNSHHNGAMSESVLKVISPQYVVFTTKDGYMPSSSYLSLLKRLGAKYYIATTKKDQNVLITSDGNNIKVKTKN